MSRVIRGRRDILRGVAGAALATALGAAFAQSGYPDRPIHLVVAYPPGGPVDTLARAVAQSLHESLGQPVVVENRPGAGGVIGSQYVAKAAPDGYTLLLGSTPLTIQETLLSSLPYSVLKDFTPVANVAQGPQALVVASKVPASNVKELIEYAKAQDGRLNYGSPSTGGSNHLAAEMFKSQAGFKGTHIPYQGGAPAMAALLSGQVAFMFAAFSSSMAQAQSGRVKVLGVSSPKRLDKAPDIPAIAETLPGFEVESWYGVLGPAHMPPEITARLNSEIVKIAQSPAMKKTFTPMDLEATPWSPAQFAQYIRDNTALWARVIKAAGVKVE